MRKLLLTSLLAAPLFAQLDSGAVTVTATRAMVLQPDQAAFSASVTAGPDSTVEDILTHIAPAGLTAANLTDISGSAKALTYNFAWVVPIAKVNETAAALQPLGISFGVTGARVSDDLLAPGRCPASELLGDATNQARKTASAIRRTVGPVLAVSNTFAAVPIAVPTIASRFGSFLVGLPGGPFLPASTLLNCSLTVKFQLDQ